MFKEYASKLKDKYFWIFFGLMVVSFCTGFYSVCNVTMLVGTSEQFSLLPDFFFFLSFGVFLVSLLLMIFIAYKKRNYRPNKILLTLFGILLLCNVLAVIFFPNGVTYSHYVLNEGYKTDLVFSVDGLRRVKSIIQFLIVLSITFVVFDILPKIFEYKSLLVVVCFCTVIIVAGFIIATYFAEFEYSYKYIFTNPNAEDIKHHGIRSLFPNGNAFGFVIFLGVIASIILNILTKKWWWLLFPIYFIISMFFAFAKLPIFAGSMLFIAYLITKLILTWKSNKKRNSIITFISLGLIVLGGVSLLIVELSTHKISSLLHNFFTFNNVNTFDSRVSIWQNVIDILAVSNWRTGLGYQIFNDLLYKFNVAWQSSDLNPNMTNSAHNGLLELLGNGGIVLLISFLVLFGILIYKSIKIFKYEKQIALFAYSLITVALVYLMFESGTFIFAYNFDYILLSIFILVPINSIYREKYQLVKS